MDRSRVRLVRTAAWILAACGLVLLGWSELFAHPQGTGFGDYQFFHHSWEAARVSWLVEGSPPLWNPFQCGGIPDWADPQAQFFHPLFFLSGVIGTTLALKTFLLLHALAGLLGMYALARNHGLSRLSSAFAASTWATSGFFAWHCGTGHGNFIAFYLAPWVLFFWRRAVEDLRFVAALAFVLSAVAFAGGAYAFPFFVLLLGFELFTLLVGRRPESPPRQRVLLTVITTAVLVACMAGLRLLPIVEYLAYFPRNVSGDDSLGPREFLWMLTRDDIHEPGVPLAGHPWVWTEYGAYIGWPAVLLGAVGAVHAVVTPGRRKLLLGALAFAVLTLGSGGPLSPWTLLHQLPVFDSLRVPSRFIVLFLLYFCLLAGRALDAWRRTPSPGAGGFRHESPFVWLRWAGPWFCVAWTVAHTVSHQRSVIDDTWNGRDVFAKYPSSEFFMAAMPRPWEPASQYPAPAYFPSANVGTGYCYTGMAYRPAPGLWGERTPQVRARGAGVVESWGRDTQSLWAVVRFDSPGRAIFNTTYAPGWATDTGTLTIDRGRVAVDLPAGRQRVRVAYAPALFPFALGLTCLGLVLGAIFALRASRWSKSLSSARALVAATLALAVVAWCYARAPRWAFERQHPAALLSRS